eukprot:scpid91833/ scgid3981/ 
MFKGWRRHESRRENLAHAYDLGMYILLEVQGRAFRIPLDRCHVNISGKDMMFAWEGMRKDEEGRGRTGNLCLGRYEKGRGRTRKDWQSASDSQRKVTGRYSKVPSNENASSLSSSRTKMWNFPYLHQQQLLQLLFTQHCSQA